MSERHMSWQSMRQRITGRMLDHGLRRLSQLASLHPRARPERYGVVVERNVPFADGLHLDVYRPKNARGDRAAMLYLHGGGFRILSKDTHWGMALSFAAEGHVVFVPNYRLAPTHPFPAAVEDAATALHWVMAHAARYGADPQQLVLAGDSAGANLTMALTVAACWPRPELFAQQLFAARPPIRAVLPACGMFHVSDPMHRGTPDGWLLDRIRAVSDGYLPSSLSAELSLDLANIAPFLEQAGPPAHALPPMFAFSGDRDPVAIDTERVISAWRKLGGVADGRIYPRGIHTFHVFLWTPLAREAWEDQHRFLNGALAEVRRSAAR